ncbi:MAG: PAS-domain containing protein [Snowella sp.]|nr:PAS-domain containing protein [Snowella sp.]
MKIDAPLTQETQHILLSLAAIAEAVVCLDSQGNLIWCNSALEKLLGLNAALLLGQPFSHLFPLYQHQFLLPFHQYPHCLIQSGTYSPQQYEFSGVADRFLNRDRPLTPHLNLEISGFLTQEQGFILIIRPLTTDLPGNHPLLDDGETAIAQRNLGKSQQLLNTVMEHIDQAMVVTDQDFRVVLFNQQFKTLFNFSDEDLFIGIAFEDLLRLWANRFQQPPEMLEKAIRELSITESFVFQHPQFSPTTGQRWIELSHNPLPTGGFVRTFTDISDRK